MANKHRADEAFDQHMRTVVLLDRPENWSALSFDIVDARAFWRAAWEAKQAADVKVVEEIKAAVPSAIVGGYCDEIKRRITGENA